MSRIEQIADGVTLHLGDSREIDFPTGIECIVTSPPYNQMEDVGKRKPTGLWGDRSGGLGFVENWKKGAYADAVDEAEYQNQQNLLFAGLAVVRPRHRFSITTSCGGEMASACTRLTGSSQQRGGSARRLSGIAAAA